MLSEHLASAVPTSRWFPLPHHEPLREAVSLKASASSFVGENLPAAQGGGREDLPELPPRSTKDKRWADYMQQFGVVKPKARCLPARPVPVVGTKYAMTSLRMRQELPLCSRSIAKEDCPLEFKDGEVLFKKEPKRPTRTQEGEETEGGAGGAGGEEAEGEGEAEGDEGEAKEAEEAGMGGPWPSAGLALPFAFPAPPGRRRRRGKAPGVHPLRAFL